MVGSAFRRSDPDIITLTLDQFAGLSQCKFRGLSLDCIYSAHVGSADGIGHSISFLASWCDGLNPANPTRLTACHRGRSNACDPCDKSFRQDGPPLVSGARTVHPVRDLRDRRSVSISTTKQTIEKCRLELHPAAWSAGPQILNVLRRRGEIVHGRYVGNIHRLGMDPGG